MWLQWQTQRVRQLCPKKRGPSTHLLKKLSKRNKQAREEQRTTTLRFDGGDVAVLFDQALEVLGQTGIDEILYDADALLSARLDECSHVELEHL